MTRSASDLRLTVPTYSNVPRLSLAGFFATVIFVLPFCCFQTLHAEVLDEVLAEKTCNEMFPNLISDFFARRDCVNKFKNELKARQKEQAVEQARQERENRARPCIADDLPRMEDLLLRIKDSLKSEMDRALIDRKDLVLDDVSKKLKEIWPEVSTEIVPSKDNIKERVLIARLGTKCHSEFNFLINVRANADGSLKWYRAWPQSPPQGYQREDDYLDFDATRNEFNKQALAREYKLKKQALEEELERENLARVARPGFPGFLADQKTGCKAWTAFPKEGEKITWNGPLY